MDEVFKSSLILADIFYDEDEQSTITGMVQILDMSDMTAGHFLAFTPALAKKSMTVWQVRSSERSSLYRLFDQSLALCVKGDGNL